MDLIADGIQKQDSPFGPSITGKRVDPGVLRPTPNARIFVCVFLDAIVVHVKYLLFGNYMVDMVPYSTKVGIWSGGYPILALLPILTILRVHMGVHKTLAGIRTLRGKFCT